MRFFASDLKTTVRQVADVINQEWCERLNGLLKSGHITIETKEPVLVHDYKTNKIQLKEMVELKSTHVEVIEKLKKDHKAELDKVNAELARVQFELDSIKLAVNTVKSVFGANK